METNNKNASNEKSIDFFKDQATDGRNIEGGGDLPNPDDMDPNLLDTGDLPEANTGENTGSDGDPDPYVHTSTG